MSKSKYTAFTNDPSLAADVLRQGGIVLFPTETVYGLGADSRNLSACLAIYKIKNRPVDNPLIVHLANPEQISEIAEVTQDAYRIIQEFMPGPITIILRKKDASVYSTGLSTIAVRVPSHKLCAEMLAAFGGPVSAPSANLSGSPSITRYEDAVAEFDGLVDLILQGEEPTIGLESTVVDLSGDSPRLLRPGLYGVEELRRILPDLVSVDVSLTETRPVSPGLKYKHYAPECEVYFVQSIPKPERNSAAIGIGINTEGWAFAVRVNDNLGYMRELYSFFRDCDKKGIRKAYCFPPANGAGQEALLNRIKKASEGSRN
ncbi:tRNA threonylcarbamoyl adenosine modification protein, Sua5/YciO/YrdC/YwlC family [Leptospira fainei serovar Hurstbridge str. BUT 6]|uniref:Threonylcarbamoyl-AMP synthase n=1 Tax=Leptospira fainei serovar Hurstbridge str. BUT 6 TaxID=1193011 RepID=S3V1I3_9LEPT|nr:L-threonylcarbamoyladenylate synthase [Leptospira fainei]EPG75303.1 tRNA threonylcarbamoyl adenosine modification protein, Sua5/YciO/YrdC/YwlC family [Leptospira fainei serovar Hurstbridge str. BUT 6]